MKVTIIILCFCFFSIIFSQDKVLDHGKYHFEKVKSDWYLKDGSKKVKAFPNRIISVIKDKNQFEEEIKNHPFVENFYYLSDNEALITLASSKDLDENLEILKKFRSITSSNPDLIFEYSSGNPTPDTYLSNQTNLEKINVIKAWNITRGNSNIIVGVVDCGADYTHSDLVENKWTEGSYQYGWTAYNQTYNNPSAVSNYYHGTTCAGIISAGSYNGEGVAGVAGGYDGDGVKIMHLSVALPGYYPPQLSYIQVRSAINKAREHNLDVLSFSINIHDPYGWITQDLNDAADDGIVIVASTGNYYEPEDEGLIDRSIDFPATHSVSIAVGAVLENYHRKELSDGGDPYAGNDWGSRYGGGHGVDVMAQGVKIPTTDITGSAGLSTSDYYLYFNGTSAACPQVAGIAALIKSINKSLSPATIRTILENTAYFNSSFMSLAQYGSGVADAYAALKYTIENYGGTFNQDVTIPAGDTWNIQSGVTLKFNSGKSLIVNGVLNANGVTFTSTSGISANSWGNIILNGSGASGSVITNSTIQYGGGVQVINVPDFEISNSTFTNNYLSVYVSGSTSGLIEDNNLTSNSSGHSIQALNSSTLDCIGNNITKTSTGQGQGAGIEYGGGTSGIISENNISYCNRGISIHWGSSASSTSTYPAKNNRVRNCGVGIIIYSSSYGTFGTSTAGNQYARNSIYSNTSNASIGTLYTTYASGLYGYYNWWGNNPPNTNLFSVGPNAYFYYNPYLTTDPWAGFAKVNGLASTNNSDINETDTPIENKGSLLEGIELRLNKKYKEAMDLFISYIKEYPSDQQAYVELYNCRSKETTSELINIFNSLPKEASKDHKLLLSYLYLNEGKIEEAKRVNELIISENPNTSLAAKASINNIYISLYNENKIETAVSAFSNILNVKDFETTKEFEDLEYALQSYARINSKTVPNFLISKNSEEQNTAATNIAEEFSLVGNYPNPFNPTTTITYVLPTEGLVQVKVFDILGREIETLVNDFKSSGKHSISWNGSKFASGMYFYSVTFKNQTLYKKMLMVK